MGERALSQEEPVVGGAELGGRPPLSGGWFILVGSVRGLDELDGFPELERLKRRSRHGKCILCGFVAVGIRVLGG